MADAKNGTGEAVVDEYKLTGTPDAWETLDPPAGWDSAYHVKVTSPPGQGGVDYETKSGKSTSTPPLNGCSNFYVKKNAESFSIKWVPN